jgi:hypothetical protein
MPTGQVEGRKDDKGKNQLELMSVPALEELGRVLTFGAKKYDERNWEKGIKWSRIYGAILRHTFAWWRGEDKDPETGLHHLAHAMCEVMFALHFALVGPKDLVKEHHLEPLDDRPFHIPPASFAPSFPQI